MATKLADDHPHAQGIRTLLTAALAIFVVTVVIGILNGTDLVDFDHKTLMGHVHSGTLGWISLSVIAASLWLFADDNDRDPIAAALPGASIVAVSAYVAAFFLTLGVMRPLTGTLVLIVMVAMIAWVGSRASQVVLSVPRLGMLAALTTLAVGAVLGVLLGLELAGTIDFLPDGAYDAHPATMVVGFLVPTGMALAEWRLTPDTLEIVADRAGRTQIAAPFIGGVLLMIGSLFDVAPLIALSLPLEITGVVILVRRLRKPIGDIDWSRDGWERGSAATVFFLVAVLTVFTYIIGRYKGEVDDAPIRLLLAVDHMTFIGVMTNALFGRVHAAGRDEGTHPLDNWIFWGMNAGIVVFALGLLGDVVALKRIGAPVMGTALLTGIVIMAMRLVGPGSSPRRDLDRPALR